MCERPHPPGTDRSDRPRYPGTEADVGAARHGTIGGASFCLARPRRRRCASDRGPTRVLHFYIWREESGVFSFLRSWRWHGLARADVEPGRAIQVPQRDGPRSVSCFLCAPRTSGAFRIDTIDRGRKWKRRRPGVHRRRRPSQSPRPEAPSCHRVGRQLETRLGVTQRASGGGVPSLARSYYDYIRSPPAVLMGARARGLGGARRRGAALRFYCQRGLPGARAPSARGTRALSAGRSGEGGGHVRAPLLSLQRPGLDSWVRACLVVRRGV